MSASSISQCSAHVSDNALCYGGVTIHVSSDLKEMAWKFNENTEMLVDNLSTVEGKLQSMTDKHCHCNPQSPMLTGARMSAWSPFELEYANKDTLMVYADPMENDFSILIAIEARLETSPRFRVQEHPAGSEGSLCLIVDNEEEGDSHVQMSESSRRAKGSL
jgi:hypothetical protein